MSKPDAPSGTSILAAMAAGTMAQKEAKAGKRLTPTPAEAAAGQPIARPQLPDVPGDFLTPEGIRDKAVDLRRYARELIAIADGLDEITGLPTAPTGAALEQATQKAIERAADQKFAERYAAQQAAAQAAVFGEGESPAPAPDPEYTGWVCPVHGGVEERTSRRSGRVYKACPLYENGCDEYEDVSIA